jgi:hypothetical protein
MTTRHDPLQRTDIIVLGPDGQRYSAPTSSGRRPEPARWWQLVFALISIVLVFSVMIAVLIVGALFNLLRTLVRLVFRRHPTN